MTILLSAFQISLIAKIEERLSTLSPPETQSVNSLLTQAMHYALLGPGKRLRPLLVLSAAELFQVPPELALDPACALEMVHAYSLIHDDLPCMDDDDLRRGRPTTHRVFGEAVAVLAGDALLTHSFEVISQAENLDESIRLQMIRCLSQRAGKRGMVCGQAKDISASPSSLPETLLMFEQKTGELFSCALEFGALMGRASRQQLERLRTLGLRLGVAYQLRDDLEDTDSKLNQAEAKSLLNSTLREIKELLSQFSSSSSLSDLIGKILNIDIQ